MLYFSTWFSISCVWQMHLEVQKPPTPRVRLTVRLILPSQRCQAATSVRLARHDLCTRGIPPSFLFFFALRVRAGKYFLIRWLSFVELSSIAIFFRDYFRTQLTPDSLAQVVWTQSEAPSLLAWILRGRRLIRIWSTHLTCTRHLNWNLRMSRVSGFFLCSLSSLLFRVCIVPCAAYLHKT